MSDEPFTKHDLRKELLEFRETFLPQLVSALFERLSTTEELNQEVLGSLASNGKSVPFALDRNGVAKVHDIKSPQKLTLGMHNRKNTCALSPIAKPSTQRPTSAASDNDVHGGAESPYSQRSREHTSLTSAKVVPYPSNGAPVLGTVRTEAWVEAPKGDGGTWLPKAEEEHKKMEQNKSGTAANSASKVMLFGQTSKATPANLDKLDYNVFDFYYSNGLFQAVARSNLFSTITLSTICVNAVYLGVDADWNDGDSLYESHTAFIVMENFFCSYFLLEWIVRFGAFASKWNCLVDTWFKFDSALVFLAICETWLLPLLLAGVDLPLSPLRLLRLLRLTRMVRIVRSFPELVTMIKGAAAAQRAVIASFLAILILIYTFAIIMNIIFKDNEELEDQFGTIGKTMWHLSMHGVFQDSPLALTDLIMEHSPLMANLVSIPLFIVFIIITALTVLNMLIGVLCHVITQVAESEKDESDISLMKSTVLVLLKYLDEDGSGFLDKHEIQTLVHDEQAAKILKQLEIDIDHFVDYMDMKFFVSGRPQSISEVMDYMLMLRGDRSLNMRDSIQITHFAIWKLSVVVNSKVEMAVDILLREMRLTSATSISVKPSEFWL